MDTEQIFCQIKSVTSRKIIDKIYCQCKIQVFQQNLKLWKTCLHHHSLTASRFSDEFGNFINECDIFILCNEVGQQLKDLHNLMNQYFPISISDITKSDMTQESFKVSTGKTNL